MPVYAKKINQAQRKAMREFENISGFEFMYQDDIDEGKISFSEAWAANQDWLFMVLSNVQNISTKGCGI